MTSRWSPARSSNPTAPLGYAIDIQAPEGAYRVSASRAGILVTSERDGGVDVDAFGPQGDVLWRDQLAGASLDAAVGVADDQGATVIGPAQVHRVTWDGVVSVARRGGRRDLAGAGQLRPCRPAGAAPGCSARTGSAPATPPFRLAFSAPVYPSGVSSVCEIEDDGSGHQVPDARPGALGRHRRTGVGRGRGTADGGAGAHGGGEVARSAHDRLRRVHHRWLRPLLARPAADRRRHRPAVGTDAPPAGCACRERGPRRPTEVRLGRSRSLPEPRGRRPLLDR